jgi:hypothetical protein
MAPKQAYSGHIFAAQRNFALHFNTAPQAGGRDFGEPSLILAPFLSVPLSPKMTLLFHAGGTPTLPSVAALKGARASCPPEPRRLRHLIALGALTSSSAINMAREVKADEDVGVPRR